MLRFPAPRFRRRATARCSCDRIWRAAGGSGLPRLISLQQGAEPTSEVFSAGWRNWQASSCLSMNRTIGQVSIATGSALRSGVASRRGFGRDHREPVDTLGFPKGDDDLGGYHLVWPRDLVEIAGGSSLPATAIAAKSVLEYLSHSGARWTLGAEFVARRQALLERRANGRDRLSDPALRHAVAWWRISAPRKHCAYGAMIETAAGYIVRNGPTTQQDRWEEDGGYTPFTLAVEIAALLAAADAMDRNGRTAIAQYLREVADGWNEQIETWTYVADTELSRKLGIEGYYIRIGLCRR